jgi:hypothetical protein
MSVLRALVAGSVVTVWMVGSGCGGAVFSPVSGDDAGDGGGPVPEASPQDAPAAVDGPPVMDAPVVVDAPVTIDSAGMCQVDGVPCLSPGQCCSGVCTGGTCGGTTPSCLGNGVACSSASECCSGDCVGTCQATTPPSCPPPANANACEVCAAGACCDDVLACEGDSVCLETQQCFNSCYAGAGSGTKCAESCLQEYPSAAAQTLFSCAASECLSSCE